MTSRLITKYEEIRNLSQKEISNKLLKNLKTQYKYKGFSKKMKLSNHNRNIFSGIFQRN